jgi:hypothetical protein
MSSAEQVTEVPQSAPLRRNAIGLPDVVFTSVTTMAPASAAAFSIAVGALFAGGSLVLGVVIALVGCMFTALSIGQMARHLPSASGMYTYIARGPAASSASSRAGGSRGRTRWWCRWYRCCPAASSAALCRRTSACHTTSGG